MRHQKHTRKLGRTSQHRDAMLANIVASLIIHKRVKTTLAKAKAARPLAEKLVTLGKSGTLHAHRLAVAKIGQRDAVATLFKTIAPGFKDRKGGYTRIIKLGPRQSDSAPVAFWNGSITSSQSKRLRWKKRRSPRSPTRPTRPPRRKKSRRRTNLKKPRSRKRR